MNVLDLFSGIGGFSSALNEPECEPSPSAKSIPIAEKSSRSTGQMSRSTKISLRENSRRRSRHRCGGFPCQDSPCRSAPDLPDCVLDYGGGFCEPFAWYDRVRIVENVATLLGRGMGKFSETWPRSGMTGVGLHTGERHWCPTRPRPSLDCYRRSCQAKHAEPVDVEMAGLSALTSYAAGRRLAQRQGLLTRRESETPQLRHLVNGMICPTWAEQFMGPQSGAPIRAPAMPSSRKSPKSSAGQS